MAVLRQFWKKETVLCIAFPAAVITMFFVPPSEAYRNYIDWRVLGLLWSLMAVVALLRKSGFFDRLTAKLLSGNKNARMLSLLLVMLPFFSSMVVTNDVALLTFVPFTVGLLSAAGQRRRILPMLILQNAAANIGSMATPVGNPQNLFLYARYTMTPGSFFSAVLPWAGAGLVILSALAMFVLPRHMTAPASENAPALPLRELLAAGALFAVCLLSVFRVLAWYYAALAVLFALLALDRKLLREPDYALLLTFVCFFVFSGNLGRMDTVRQLLQRLLERDAMLTTALASQVISNVPAAVLLSGFTGNGTALLIGADLGGFGTPVASLASLITMKLFFRSDGADKGKFILWFMVFNVVMLALFLGAAEILC